METNHKYRAIVIGTSAGGLYALSAVLENIPPSFSLPIVIVQHRAKNQSDLLEDVLGHKCKIKIKQADEKEKIQNSIVYIAPPDYHLLIEKDFTFSLTVDEPVHYSRPSIDVLFESAAMVYKEKLVGIILTGSNNDGASGISMIRKNGGFTIAQNPDEAPFPFMPLAAIETKDVMRTWTISEIQAFMLKITA